MQEKAGMQPIKRIQAEKQAGKPLYRQADRRAVLEAERLGHKHASRLTDI